MKSSAIIKLYYLLSFIYFSQSFIFDSEMAIGKPILICIMIINLFYMFKVIRLRQFPMVVKSITIFVILNTAYYLIGDYFIHNVDPAKSFQIYKGILLATTCIYPLYYWSLNGYRLRALSLLLAALYFASIYYSGTQREMEGDFVDNMGYYYLNFIPFLFIIPRHVYVKIAIWLLLNVLIITSAKRGAIITAGAVDIVFLLYMFKSGDLSKNIFRKIIVLFILICACSFAWNKLQTNSFVLERFTALENGNSSGRDVIYANLIDNWSNKYDAVQTVFGGGFCKSPRINRGLFAHNDWLELLTDLGLVGVFSYLVLIISMLTSGVRSKDMTIKFTIAAIGCIWLLKTFFSMSYLDENSFILMLLLGIMIAQKQQINYEIKKA